jgi:hypothetical protein
MAVKPTVVVAVLLVASVVSAVACEGEGPECVLDCYSAAFANMDLQALSDLYADDYSWIIVVPPEALAWDREKALQSAEGMFTSPKVSQVTLQFPAGYRVEKWKDDGTWLITGLEASMIVPTGEPAATDTSRTCMTIYVREGEPGSYQIFREVAFGNGDCTEWTEK